MRMCPGDLHHPQTSQRTTVETGRTMGVTMGEGELETHGAGFGYTVDHNRRLLIHVFRRPIRSGVGLHLLASYTRQGLEQ
jgi:hypothetical protein